MNATMLNRRRTVDQSPKETLRAYIEELSLEMQLEFITVALQLIANRPATCEILITPANPFHLTMRTRIIGH
jgi:hypothetical protein